MTPFVSKAVALCQSIREKKDIICKSLSCNFEKTIIYRCDFKAKEITTNDYGRIAEEEFLESGSHINRMRLVELKQDFLAFQDHFINYPVVNAHHMRFLFSYWNLEIDMDLLSCCFISSYIQKIAEIAEKDGIGQGREETVSSRHGDRVYHLRANKKESIVEISEFYDTELFLLPFLKWE